MRVKVETSRVNLQNTEKLNRFFYRLISEALTLGADKISFEKDSQLRLTLLSQANQIKSSAIKGSWFNLILAWLIDRTVSPLENQNQIRTHHKTHLVISSDELDQISFVCYIACGSEYLECDVLYFHQHENEKVITLSGFRKNHTNQIIKAPKIVEEIPEKIEVSDDFFMSQDLQIHNKLKIEPQVFKILIVEDDIDQRSIIEMVLKDAGYEVYAASDGKEGFELLEKVNADLVVSDLMMPGVDGATLIRRIKSDNRFKTLPILVLTVINDSEKEYQILSLGVDDYCEKTVQRNILLKRIENLLKRSKS